MDILHICTITFEFTNDKKLKIYIVIKKSH
jgi:hypothetical protein